MSNTMISLAEEICLVRTKIDGVFDWNAHLPGGMSIRRGAMQAAMMLYGRTSE